MTRKQLTIDDEAVSPVIGVILMVAITVILAAVIGAFVLNLGNQLNSGVRAGVNVQEDPGNDSITLTWSQSQNAEYLTLANTGTCDGLAINNDSQDKGDIDLTSNDTTQILDSVGNSYKLYDCTDGESNQIIVNGHKGEQSTAVLTQQVET